MQRESDPVYRAVGRAFMGGDVEAHVGGPLDVRAVRASISPRAKDVFAYGRVPWERFPRGPETRDAVACLRSNDADAVREALRCLNGELANGAWSVVALAVPFLLRIAADPRGQCRARALELAAGIAQWTPGPGRCTREELLRSSDGERRFEPSGYPGHWGIEAARDAIAADLDLVTALLDDPASEVRVAAAYAGAVASGRISDVRNALHVRLRIEADPVVRAGLVLALAQLACEHPDAGCLTWIGALWSDPGAPPAVRVGAAFGWLCLTEAPATAGLLAALDACATDETARLMASLPWMRAVDHGGETGLRRCLRGLLHPDDAEPASDDPWA
ncbi:hypothetical protein [Actinomadura parmotrematis]|uniref:HEAT repeat domain-containing protein n=1 Tax=Actinomadura parmotrematis TaxID=2864039 RepID=A0ABS7FV82_9ACTN|nr:hypothetical protein [Actinomadura parmotrematis]MBW8484231.1 hypothetical protein [Actinomadura parmotrematis]